jgi:hypothetical protein
MRTCAPMWASEAACPISTSSPPTTHYGSSPCCTMPGGFDITPWADRVQLVDAKYAGTWELPALGPVTPPTAVLIRPDGYVAWVGDRTQLGLADALTTWIGPPAAV